MISKNRFYKANEEITLRFYQLPEVLLTNPRYAGLSLGAMTMYSILRDRQELSVYSNSKDEEKWIDEDGNIYLNFKTEPHKDDKRPMEEKELKELSLTEILSITKNTVTKYKKELREYNLIVEKKVGQGKRNRIYVLKPELVGEMNTTTRFYKANEVSTLKFYQIPKVLFTNPRYAGLSLGAKAMYSILRDRQELSVYSNSKDEEKWIDEDGNIYLNFKTEPHKDDKRPMEEKELKELSLTEILSITKNTVTKYKKELREYNLIVEKRVGQGNPNRIYVLKPELVDLNVDIYKTPKNRDSSIPPLNHNNWDSKVTNNKSLDSQILNGNDTDVSYTDFSDTIFLSPEDISKESSYVDNFNSCQNNERKKEVHKPLNEFQTILESSGYKDFEEKYSRSLLHAIRLLYFSKEPLKIGNISIPPSQVREDLKMLEWKHLDLGLRDYLIQAKEQEIRNPAAYLSRCIYNAIFQGDLRVETELLFHDLI